MATPNEKLAVSLTILRDLQKGQRFADEWRLSPEQSLLLHAENTVIPAHVIVYSTREMNNKITLLFNTSLYDLKQPQMPPTSPRAMALGSLRSWRERSAT
jgi:hypothetical protein